ncbi:hypothetical protein EZV62_000439 [Acer yangbiense]|uniref:Protein FAR1-RELATED SEQUENCE n=1 Tax=Acer yangbiense TaxID=1000413 RepID=A0A5C7IRB7_9ROSI|nr:hypothetical protein EZV62_000439 [Acer yangbiense]
MYETNRLGVRLPKTEKMGLGSGSTQFPGMQSLATDLNTEVCGNTMIVKAFPLGMLRVANNVNIEDDGESTVEPHAGLEFDSADDARDFYSQYATRMGFKTRTGQLYRSRTDGSVSSRRFVCSKEGFQLNSRTGCPAFIRVQKRDSGKWVLDQIQKDHNHELGSADDNGSGSPIVQQSKIAVTRRSVNLSQRSKFKSFTGLDDGRPCPSGIINFKRPKKAGDGGESIAEPSVGLEFNSANEAYLFYQTYAENIGFRIRIGQLFRSKNDGSVTSRRFVCSKEGFQHPSRVGCGAFMRIKRQEFGSWVVDRLLKEHNHDLEAQDGINRKISTASRIFIDDETDGLDSVDLAEELEILRSMPSEFRYDYEKCVYQSQTNVEFNTMWSALINKHCLKENVWLKEMYEKRESWVPLYLRGAFFAGIPLGESVESFFGTTLTAQTSLGEFVSRYNQVLERRREEESKADYNTFNMQAFLQTKEPIEEQCRRLYTITIFKIFQDELMQSYNYAGIKTYEEETIVRYLVRKCGNGNENEKHAVTFSAVSVSCSCQMFEFEGMLCRHILKVFNLLDIKEIPPQYLLHRWTRNAVYGIVREVESGASSQELKALMVWSLRETACKYIESGTTTLEKYKLAFEIMREGGNKLSWQR